jgi:hypothetical protein
MSNHAILGPSAASRWLTCTPSARFEQFQPNEETEYAREGTIAHEIAALVLAARSGTYAGKHSLWLKDLAALEAEAKQFYEDKGKTSQFQSMYEHAEDYAQYVLSQTPNDGEVHIGGEFENPDFDDIARRILIETRYDIFDYVPLGFGTGDVSTRTRYVLYITDYKYGEGVRVSAIQNKQMKLYGLGGLKAAIADGWTEIHTVVLSIYQPRAGGASSWQIGAKELLEWGEDEVKPKAVQAIAGIGEFVPGKHCQFCKARNVCKAFYDQFDDLAAIKDKREITKDELAYLLNIGPDVKSWITKMIDETTRRMEKGDTVEGFKLVKGKGRRAFTSEDKVVDILIGEDFDTFDIYNMELKSLTDLEKQLGKKKFNALLSAVITKSDGKPAIASEDDDRPAISVGSSGYDEVQDYSEEDEDIL